MSSLKLELLFIAVLFSASCGVLNPFIDRHRNPGVQDINKLYSGPSKPDAPAICYNALWTDDEELDAMAVAECKKHGTGNSAELVDKTYIDGKLLLPNHAFYKCVTIEE